MQQKKHSYSCRAFTLIELLVVVLIIGILAAVTVPQYQKAVWKTRYTQLKSAVSSLAKAQQVYYLANNTYSTEFKNLDIKFDNLSPKTSSRYLGVPSSDAVRTNDWMDLAINHGDQDWFFSSAVFTSGPYSGGGISFIHQDTTLSENTYYCIEAQKIAIGSFCPTVAQTSATYTTIYGFRYFAL